jgi:hypothetical protein
MVVNRVIGAMALLLSLATMPAFAHDADGLRADDLPLRQALHEARKPTLAKDLNSQPERRADVRALRDLSKDRHVDPRGYWHVHYGWGFRYLGPRFWGIGYY